MVTLSNGMTNFSENISEFEEAILAVSQTDEEAKKLIPKLIMKIMGKRQVFKSYVRKLKSFMMVLKDSSYRMWPTPISGNLLLLITS